MLMGCFLLILNLFQLTSTAQGQLYPIREGEGWGYINHLGQVQIPPKFKAAGAFSEGLAAVRVEGTYGYIDASGSLVIAPRFDFALPFSNGRAKVYLSDKAYFINNEGEIAFVHAFENIESYGNRSYAFALTPSGKFGLINWDGQLLTDTIFKEIRPFSEGAAVVYGLRHQPFPRSKSEVPHYEVGLIDTAGQWLIPFGMYRDLGSLKNGYTTAVRYQQEEAQQGWSRDDAVIDKHGHLQFIQPAGKFFLNSDHEGFYEGLAVVDIYQQPTDEAKNHYSSKYYAGVVNLEGQILFGDSSWKTITPFAFNRAFVQQKDGRWFLINREGQRLSDSIYLKVLYSKYGDEPKQLWYGGTAWVKLASGWAEIDTAGRILSTPRQFTGYDDHRLERRRQYLLLEKVEVEEADDEVYGRCLWNGRSKAPISQVYQDFDWLVDGTGLISATKAGQLVYLNADGELVWQASSTAQNGMANLNIDFMNRGYFYAYSAPKERELGGYGSSSNVSQKISPKQKFPAASLSVRVEPKHKAVFADELNGIRVYVANTTAAQIDFAAQDSRLYMKVQARDAEGVWRDIEYLPSSWCGNSYHVLSLAPQKYWSFVMPVYEGALKTQMRIELQYLQPRFGQEGDENDERPKLVVYSNEFAGSVNPGQFWRKPDYNPVGLMDPYND